MELMTKQGYKQTEVGLIPVDWEVKVHDDIAETIDSLHQTPSFSDDGYSMVRVTDIKLGNLILKNTKKVSQKVFNEFTRNYKPLQNDIVMSRVGSYGVVSYVNTAEPFCLGQNTVVIHPKYESRYLYYILSSQIVINQIELESYGSGYKSLSLKNIKELKIPLPPTLTEQKAIATALSDVDALIASLEQTITKKKAIKQGAMQQLLTPPNKGGKRLPGFSGEWEEKNLGELGECIIGLTYKPTDVSDNGTLVLRSSNIQNDQLSFKDNVFVKTKIPERLRTQIDDILVCVRNGSRNLIGKCARIDNRCVNESFGAFMSMYRSPYNRFISHVFKSYSIQKQIEENLGATINQITNKTLNSFRIWFPEDEKERNSIASFIDDMDAEITQLETKKEKYQAIKQGMMQELLTGKTRLI